MCRICRSAVKQEVSAYGQKTSPRESIAELANVDCMKPKYCDRLCRPAFNQAKHLSVIGSYGWGGKAVQTLAGMTPNLKVEVIEPHLTKGLPDESDCDSIAALANEIANRHEELGLLQA